MPSSFKRRAIIGQYILTAIKTPFFCKQNRTKILLFTKKTTILHKSMLSYRMYDCIFKEKKQKWLTKLNKAAVSEKSEDRRCSKA